MVLGWFCSRRRRSLEKKMAGGTIRSLIGLGIKRGGLGYDVEDDHYGEADFRARAGVVGSVSVKTGSVSERKHEEGTAASTQETTQSIPPGPRRGTGRSIHGPSDQQHLKHNISRKGRTGQDRAGQVPGKNDHVDTRTRSTTGCYPCHGHTSYIRFD